jgi:hypothetical protein
MRNLKNRLCSSSDLYAGNVVSGMGGQLSGCAVMARAATMLALIIGPRNSHFNPLKRIMLITPPPPVKFTRLSQVDSLHQRTLIPFERIPASRFQWGDFLLSRPDI